MFLQSLIFHYVHFPETSVRIHSQEICRKIMKCNQFCQAQGGEGMSNMEYPSDDEAPSMGNDGTVSNVSQDWRAFRARLVSLEKSMTPTSESDDQQSSNSRGNDQQSQTTSNRWAHPLSNIEPGCVLIATEQLDGNAFFERSVVLMINFGEEDAPWGVVLNKPHPHRVGKIRGMANSLSKAFEPCRAFVGGPIDHQRFILLHGVEGLNGFREVLPGTFVGGVLGIESALAAVFAEKAKPEDFTFYFGYAGWDSQQLEKEIKLGWWHVAACSPNFVLEQKSSKGSIWEQILTLMGDKYAQLAQRKL